MADRVFGLKAEVAGGLFLAAAAVLGLVVENLEALRPYYDTFLTTNAAVSIGAVKVGTGFTMSLFIGGLAIDAPGKDNAVGAGVLMGSILSGITGSIVLADVRKPLLSPQPA